MIKHTIRAGRVVGGIVLLVVGFVLALPFVPGPGIPIMFIGLTALSYEFEWARRLRRWAHDEVQRRLRRPDA